jgi:hypothetical protein
MIKFLSRFGALTVVALWLAGCAGVVYKDAAASYVAASKDLVKQLNEVSGRLTAAEDMRRRQDIVKDSQCPIAQDRIFVRAHPAVKFTPLLQAMPNMAAVPGCPQLVACEQGDIAPVCAQSCYSANEGNCLKILEQEYARADAKLSGPNGTGAGRQQVSSGAKELVRLLHQVEYQRGDSLTSQLIADNLQILAQYLDLLEKASTSNKVDFTKDVQRITDRIDTVTNWYSKITGDQLSSADTATRDNITKSIGLLGTLGGHLKTLSANAKNAEQIKAFVRNNAGVADSLIVSIENVIKGDDYLGVVLNNDAVMNSRQAVADRYRVAMDTYERGILLDEALKYQYTTASASQKKLKDVFVALRQSHDTLNRLVLNPDDEQLRAIHSEEFQNFRTVAQDVAGLIGQFAKF